VCYQVWMEEKTCCGHALHLLSRMGFVCHTPTLNGWTVVDQRTMDQHGTNQTLARVVVCWGGEY
jgi:hypothetical protein